jgi:hypothetical protein
MRSKSRQLTHAGASGILAVQCAPKEAWRSPTEQRSCDSAESWAAGALERLGVGWPTWVARPFPTILSWALEHGEPECTSKI